METIKEKNGIVTKIKNDRKGIQLNGGNDLWFGKFVPLKDGFVSVGDEVHITYEEKANPNGSPWKNIKSIEVIQPAMEDEAMILMPENASMTKCVAAKCAAQLMSAQLMSNHADSEIYFSVVANDIYAWLMGDEKNEKRNGI